MKRVCDVCNKIVEDEKEVVRAAGTIRVTNGGVTLDGSFRLYRTGDRQSADVCRKCIGMILVCSDATIREEAIPQAAEAPRGR